MIVVTVPPMFLFDPHWEDPRHRRLNWDNPRAEAILSAAEKYAKRKLFGTASGNGTEDPLAELLRQCDASELDVLSGLYLIHRPLPGMHTHFTVWETATRKVNELAKGLLP